MTALTWIKDKATALPVELLEISEEAAAEANVEAGTYEVHTVTFSGTLPTRMASQLRKELRKTALVSDELRHEVVQIGGEYRSDYGRCFYSFTEYRKAAA